MGFNTWTAAVAVAVLVAMATPGQGAYTFLKSGVEVEWRASTPLNHKGLTVVATEREAWHTMRYCYGQGKKLGGSQDCKAEGKGWGSGGSSLASQPARPACV